MTAEDANQVGVVGHNPAGVDLVLLPIPLDRGRLALDPLVVGEASLIQVRDIGEGLGEVLAAESRRRVRARHLGIVAAAGPVDLPFHDMNKRMLFEKNGKK